MADLFLIELATDAVLGAEEFFQLHAGGIGEEIDGAVALGVDAGLIGDEADAQAVQVGELSPGEDVDAIEHGGHLGLGAGPWGAGGGNECDALGGGGADFFVQVAHAAFAIGVEA